MSSRIRTSVVPSGVELDIFAFLTVVWRQKKLMVLVTLGAGLLAASYALLAMPGYMIIAVLRPAAINELDALNRSEVYSLPPSEALLKVGAALDSHDTRLAFFRDNQTLFEKFVRPGQTLEQSFEQFNENSIHLTFPVSEKNSSLGAYIKLEMSYPKGIDGVAILNGIIDYAIASERARIGADLTVIVKNRLAELKGELDSVRSSYEVDKKARIASLREVKSLKRGQLQDELKALRSQLKVLRSDRIAQLVEAIGIASSLGIQKPATPSSLGESVGARAGNLMHAEVSNQQIPLYFMGVQALTAELTALQRRRSDDFTNPRIAQIARELQLLASSREVEVLNARKSEDVFLASVQPLRAEMVRLSNLKIDMSGLKLVAIDQQALLPVSPNRPLIVILGLLLGGAIAICIAAVRHTFAVASAQAETFATFPPVSRLQSSALDVPSFDHNRTTVVR